MLMVADETMYAFYRDGLEEYLLTIANMVGWYSYTLIPSLCDDFALNSNIFNSFGSHIYRNLLCFIVRKFEVNSTANTL